MGIRERKEREFQRREREILDAALALFNRDDWQSVTVERIAQEAEIGKGTVYKHFDSKEEIYARLALDFLHGIVYRLQQVDIALGVVEQLRVMIRVYWDAHMESKEYARVVMYCSRDDFRACLRAETQAAFEAVDDAFAEVVHPLIERGVSEGIFPQKSVPLLLFGAAAALKGGIAMAWSECPVKGLKPREHREELTSFILAGLIHQGQRA